MVAGPRKVRRIGILTGGTALSRLAEGSAALKAFREGLAKLGWVEGKNVVFERRDAEGRFKRLPALAAELVRLPVDLILAPSTPDAEVAKEATATIPIVFVGADPVGTGLIASLERPGGNVTGLTVGSHARARRVALLREVIPALSRVAVLVNLSYASVPFQLRQTEMAAQSFGLPVRRFEVRDSKDLPDALFAVSRWHPDGLIVLLHPMFAREAHRLASFATRTRLPMVAPYTRIAEAGALLAYEPDPVHPFRRAAIYVDKILKGAAPANLAVEESTKFRCVVNLRAARAIRVRIPQSVLTRADRVIN